MMKDSLLPSGAMEGAVLLYKKYVLSMKNKKTDKMHKNDVKNLSSCTSGKQNRPENDFEHQKRMIP